MRRPRRFHIESLEGRVVLSPVLSPPVSAPASGAALVTTQGPTQSSTELNTQTKNNLRDVMGDEAFAYAEYRAYAAAAQQSGDKQLASVWKTVADVEFEDHFSQEAQFSGLVQDNVSNLKTVIAAEAAAIKTYTNDARQAFKAGYPEVGKTFQEIAADEKTHYDLFTQALSALQGHGNVPPGPTVEPTKIVPSKPAASGQTLDNIIAASKDEAFARAEYTLFARQAANTGQARLAALFTDIARVELKDHFAKEANLSGLVGSNAANLRASIDAETGAAKKYQDYAQQANRAGDQAVAALFGEIAIDEQGHAKAFQELLNSQTGRTH